MKRQISQIPSAISPVTVEASFNEAPLKWLETQAQAHQLRYLLAYADDGIIWGRLEDKNFGLSDKGFPEVSPHLQAITLQQARLFGTSAELLIWRVDEGWQARLVQDNTGQPVKYYDEFYLLWGNVRRQEDAKTGFTLIADGVSGQRQAVPLALDEKIFSHNHYPVQLQVRHYLIREEASGLLREGWSRLVTLKGKQNEAA